MIGLRDESELRNLISSGMATVVRDHGQRAVYLKIDFKPTKPKSDKPKPNGGPGRWPGIYYAGTDPKRAAAVEAICAKYPSLRHRPHPRIAV